MYGTKPQYSSWWSLIEKALCVGNTNCAKVLHTAKLKDQKRQYENDDDHQ